SGEADIFTARGTERLQSGQTLYARGNPDDPEYQVTGAIGLDDFDRWNQRRDEDIEQSQAYRYVSPEISGAEDLDQHGRWVETPDYGNVWTPAVTEGWAPYQDGRWTWVDYY